MAFGRFFTEEDGDDRFFDSRDDLSSVFDSCPGTPTTSHASFTEETSVRWASGDSLYQVWMKSPVSIQERRAKFMLRFGLDTNRSHRLDSTVPYGELGVDDTSSGVFDRLPPDCCSMLRGCDLGNGSLLSCCSDVDTRCTSQVRSCDERFFSGIHNLNNGMVNGGIKYLQEPVSDQTATIDEVNRSICTTPVVQQSMRRGDSSTRNNSDELSRRKRVGWLRRLGAIVCIVDRQGYEFDSGFPDSVEVEKARFRRVRVQSYNKQSKEFSAVYMMQNFKAHHGAILTMKFSPDGKYLATGGEDGVVRVWQVTECARHGEDGLPDDDPSCIFFRVNRKLELSPLYAEKEKKKKVKGLLRSSDSACVVIPPEVFGISEKPLYEFHGHKADVLDLAWSNDECLLSSSVDKTVRLWQLGHDGCLKVFAHNNYVTCVQFNPIDERFFVSGSIDGKVRIWEILTSRVVSWSDVKQIVTAVCYRPDGKGLVVGSMAGDCCFYDISGNNLRLDTKILFEGKKKSLEKRITSFQYCPDNSRMLMVTSADSIRILDGVDVVSKFKGLGNARSHVSATFTTDGQHIVSSVEDSNSNVYIWNHSNKDRILSFNPKSIVWSSERFVSSHAHIAIPWQGFSSSGSCASQLISSQEGKLESAKNGFPCLGENLRDNTLYLSPSNGFTLSRKFLVDVLPRGSATWPEEKLPSSITQRFGLGRSQFKFLKASCRKGSSHAWGQVIVTAGWDGHIRSFQNYGLPATL